MTDARAVASRFASREAEWIINATAYNDVGAAEENPLPAFAVNAAAVAILARQARQVGARFVHFSTDYVFSGEKGAAYVENDPPCPQNVYAVSKLAGEALAMRAGTWFIFRLSALFGTTGCRTKGGGNFVEKILEQAQAGRTLQVVEDAVCTPTFSLDVARFLRDRLFSLAPGLYHLANAGPCSWFEFAREILSQAGMADTPVVGIKRQGPVPVPANSALASESCRRCAPGARRCPSTSPCAAPGIITDEPDSPRQEEFPMIHDGASAGDWKGIVLAGGAGTRLFPTTLATNKHLLPVYDKPMVYYPIGTLLLAGIREILIISTPEDPPRFQQPWATARDWACAQLPGAARPEGIAQAFLLARDFIAGRPVCLVLGDNIFYGDHDFLRRALQRTTGASIFGYHVADPQRYGVVEFDAAGRVLSIEEKPARPRSPYAVVGLYCYDTTVIEIAERLRPSARGELEITDVNIEYLRRGGLHVEILRRGIAWLDTGTPRSLLEAGSFIGAVESRQGLSVACLEEIALRMGFISARDFAQLARQGPDGPYYDYLRALAAEMER
ncbi:glucose-1-phosphate thymidylyltransferase RfbA [bacterium]|nr:glucose-1-phosphate thymidylyltransferase RfbA [bacterium]